MLLAGLTCFVLVCLAAAVLIQLHLNTPSPAPENPIVESAPTATYAATSTATVAPTATHKPTPTATPVKYRAPKVKQGGGGPPPPPPTVGTPPAGPDPNSGVPNYSGQ